MWLIKGNDTLCNYYCSYYCYFINRKGKGCNVAINKNDNKSIIEVIKKQIGQYQDFDGIGKIL